LLDVVQESKIGQFLQKLELEDSTFFGIKALITTLFVENVLA
jgi:hypothetical protein